MPHTLRTPRLKDRSPILIGSASFSYNIDPGPHRFAMQRRRRRPPLGNRVTALSVSVGLKYLLTRPEAHAAAVV